ncbi:MAG: hypothetical protein HYV32_06640 [Candidatus Kerfeldbacteria bacterium]|nr:hypothetical protein [Candidatus Kerfeldbacteria bacterium]
MNHKRHWLPSFTAKEWTLISLILVLAGLAIYTTRYNQSAFGLITSEDTTTGRVVSDFPTDTLLHEQVLALDVHAVPQTQPQVEATFLHSQHPAPVTHLTAFNTRIGGEAVLFWTRPDGVESVNIYRSTTHANIPTADELVATHIIEESFLDTGLDNAQTYTYRVVSVNTFNEIEYTSDTAPTVSVIPADTIPPLAPTDIIITSTQSDNQYGVHIQWVNPTVVDFDHLNIFRSTTYGIRGEQIATVKQSEIPAFTDTSAVPNAHYYYTLVAVDASGNPSSDAFSMPIPGNTEPFTPIPVLLPVTNTTP